MLQSLVSLFKTPEKGTLATAFASEESPSERSTIPQLFTPEINAVLDLDVSIKWRGLGDHGMSPLPAVTPLVIGSEPAATEFRASQQPNSSRHQEPSRARSLRSHRTLDFSNIHWCAPRPVVAPPVDERRSFAIITIPGACHATMHAPVTSGNLMRVDKDMARLAALVPQLASVLCT